MTRHWILIATCALAGGCTSEPAAVLPVPDVSQVTAYYLRCGTGKVEFNSCSGDVSKAGMKQFTVIISAQRVVPNAIWTLTDCKVFRPDAWECVSPGGATEMWGGLLKLPPVPNDSLIAATREQYCAAPDTLHGPKPSCWDRRKC